MLDAEGVAYGSRYNLALSRSDKALAAVEDIDGKEIAGARTMPSSGIVLQAMSAVAAPIAGLEFYNIYASNGIIRRR